MFEVEMRELLKGGEVAVHTFQYTAGSHDQAAAIARKTNPQMILLSTQRISATEMRKV